MHTPFPTTRPFTTAALAGSADIQSIQAFYGSIATIDDALILIEAVRRRKAPRVHHRLTEDEQLAIGSGSIFVWNEEEAQIKRWTDGRHWSNSRMKGRFFMYKELSASKKTGTTRGRVAIAAVAAAAAASSSTTKPAKGTQAVSASSNPQGNSRNDAGSTDEGVDAGMSSAGPAMDDEPLAAAKEPPRAGKLSKKRKAAAAAEDDSSSDRLFLRKKTISVRTRKNERFHLVAYYHEHEEASLTRPSQVPRFAELPIEPGFYLTGLDATPLMVANPTVILASTGAAAAAAAAGAFRPPSPVSQGHIHESANSRYDTRQTAPTSRTMAKSAANQTMYAAYGPQHQTMPPPRHPHSSASAPTSLAPPPPPTSAAAAPYPQTWPAYPSSAAAALYHPHAPFNYYPDGHVSQSASADYYGSGYSHPHGGWPYGPGEPRDRDYPQYEPSRPTSYAPAGAIRALRAPGQPSNAAASGSSDARTNEPLHSPTSAHSNPSGSWEDAPLHARNDSGSYSRYPTSVHRSAPAQSRNHNPPPPHSPTGYYYPPTPTSYGFGDPFGYHGPPPPPTGSGSMAYGTGYPAHSAAGAHSYSGYSEYRGGPAYLDPAVASSYYPQLPTPNSARTNGRASSDSHEHEEEFTSQ